MYTQEKVVGGLHMNERLQSHRTSVAYSSYAASRKCNAYTQQQV